jgi:predicted dehydrogenase
LHTDGVVELLGYGWHVNLQKPMCNDLPSAQRMLDAARANGNLLRVMENYLFYEPLRKLKETVESGELGEVTGYHMKMVASGRGGWDVPASSYEWQFRQMQRGRGILLFDDGWHKLATAIWLFGPVKEVRAWVGGTEVVPGVEIDAPTTVVWEHHDGIRGVWDVTLAVDMYLRSDYYTNDERWEVTGRKGFARVNRCTGRGIQQPSLEVYVDGEMRSFHALDDDWASTPADTGYVGCTPATAPCGGAARRPSTCCASRWPLTRAARPAGSESTLLRWSSSWLLFEEGGEERVEFVGVGPADVVRAALYLVVLGVRHERR